MKRIKLNIGSGRDKREDWISCDIRKPYDKYMDLNKYPYPFKKNSVDEIYCKYVLEHIDKPFDAIKEFHRILKSGGKLHLIVPHYSNAISYIPTHKSFFNYDCLDCFDIETNLDSFNSEYYNETPFIMEKRLNSTIWGRFFPQRVLKFLSLFIGHLATDIEFWMVKV